MGGAKLAHLQLLEFIGLQVGTIQVAARCKCQQYPRNLCRIGHADYFDPERGGRTSISRACARNWRFDRERPAAVELLPPFIAHPQAPMSTDAGCCRPKRSDHFGDTSPVGRGAPSVALFR